jgi:MoaA/NifB/PqqE/SkfB family radical SAM enzyme
MAGEYRISLMETTQKKRPSARRKSLLRSPRRGISLAQRGVKNYLLKKPLTISFEITHACNANCLHCHRGGPVREDRASPRDYALICQEVKPVVAQFSGGEPLLRHDLEDIVRAVRVPNRAPYIVVTTNAALLTQQRYDALRQAGVDEFSISLDYPDERHDNFRQVPGLFEKITCLIEGLNPTEGKPITLCCVVQRDNFRDLPRMAELARKWNVKVNFSSYTPLRTDDRGYLIPEEDLEEFREITRQLLAFRKAQDTVFNSEYAFQKMIQYFEQGSYPHCRTGERFCNVNPNGTFSPCGLIITNFRTLKELRNEFARTNSCIYCLTSIRSNCEKSFWQSALDTIKSL